MGSREKRPKETAQQPETELGNDDSSQAKTVSTIDKPYSSFRAGNIKTCLHNWRHLTKDRNIIDIVTGVKLEFTEKPVQKQAPCQIFNGKESALVQTEVTKLLDKGVLVGSSHEPDEFISNIFLRKKRDGTYRMILNLKELNKFIVYQHFKMDSLHAATELMTPGCFMASIDLKDAYYTVPIHPDFQKYLKFKFNGKLYQYTCLPNGLSSAPRLFTKLMKPVYATLREQGHTNLGYIDDSLLLGDTVTECASSVRATKDLVEHVGFTPHLEKSIFAPTQIIVFLGFTLNSITMTVTPTHDKVMKTRQCCLALLAKQPPTIQDLAEVIGVLVANFPGVEFGPLHYRNLEKDKVQALTASKGSYQGLVQLSKKSLKELQWWIDNIATSHKCITHVKSSVTIQSDASTVAWGAALSGQSTGGRWSTPEQQQHINVLELKAALFGLQAFCSEMTGVHVKLELDNTTAIAYINHMGGSKSEKLNQLAYDLWDWCRMHNIWVTAAHIPGVQNVIADRRSRRFKDEHEWQLNKPAFQQILHNYPDLKVDLFASRLNYQLDIYASWEPDPLCTYVDAFTIDWGKLNFYAFPPFSLVQRCIKKIQIDQATGILVAPLWPTQTWFTPLLQLLHSPPWVLNQHPDKILSHPHYKAHPIPKLRLIVCPVSGNPSHTSNNRQKLPKLSWLHGEPAQKSNTIPTSTSGWTFVIKDRLIHINQE